MVVVMLRLSKREADAIRSHATSVYPDECCGVLLGRLDEGARLVRESIPATNVSGEFSSSRYSIAPEELIQIQKKSRESGLDIIGFYHSHPDHPADWSPTDLKEAHWFACSYLIVSVKQGKPAEMCSFVLAGTSDDDKRFDEEKLEMEDSVSG